MSKSLQRWEGGDSQCGFVGVYEGKEVGGGGGGRGGGGGLTIPTKDTSSMKAIVIFMVELMLS